MQNFPSSIEDWLRHEAPLVVGPSFVFNERSYLPVSLESEGSPVGFLVTDGDDVQFVPAESEAGAAPALAWAQEAEETAIVFPSEYWVG